MRQLSVCGVRGNEDFGGEKKRLPRQEGDWEINGQEWICIVRAEIEEISDSKVFR